MRRSGWMLLPILATVLPSAAAADANMLGSITSRLSTQERDLNELAHQLERALDSGNTTLRSIARRLTTSGAADRAEVVSTLRALRPELARARTLSNRRHNRQRPWRASGSSQTSQEASKSGSPRLHWGQPLGLVEATESGPPTRTIWLRALADEAEQDDRDAIDGYEQNTIGLELGYERSVSGALNLGISIARLSTDVDSNALGDDKIDTTEIALSANYVSGVHSIMFAVSYADNKTDRLRSFNIVREDGRRRFDLNSEIDARQLTASIGWSGFYTPAEAWQVVPFVNLGYARLATDDYAEFGAGDELALVVSTADEDQLLGTAGLSVGYAITQGNWLIAPSVAFAYEYGFNVDVSETQSRFRRTDFAFSTRGFSTEKTRLRTSLGIQLVHYSGFAAGLNFEANSQGNYDYRALTLSLQTDF